MSREKLNPNIESDNSTNETNKCWCLEIVSDFETPNANVIESCVVFTQSERLVPLPERSREA